MKFDISQYETVEERIKRFYQLNDDGRIITRCEVAGVDGQWLFRAEIYLNAEEQAVGLPKATGYASERDGGPQSEWKAELGETSAIGRALANMNLSGNKRSSREEMQKVARAEIDWLAEADKILNIDDLRSLYTRAKAQGAPDEVLERLKDYGEALSPTGQDKGTGRSAARSPKK
jgi:hypothetical protein